MYAVYGEKTDRQNHLQGTGADRNSRLPEFRYLNVANLCCAAVYVKGGDGWDRDRTGRAARRARNVTRKGRAVVSCFCVTVRIYGMDYGRGCVRYLEATHTQKKMRMSRGWRGRNGRPL